ncbi:MAG: glutamine--fructose-6-phosphate transaminase (isomerizing) [Gammaproteobacteria bacterium]|nr:glutamine--fructose-6-phosphate transaminase (isomerizing) [Gammaproteobacteria bacterium]
MCGIIGAIAQRDISDILLECLKRLEYRGYDSAGLVTISLDGQLRRLRTEGKVQALISKAQEHPIPGYIGVAHTRWATHGRPAEHNAHPHLSHQELAVVHNGIIENHLELRTNLISKGYQFDSETDTEVAAHLIHDCYQSTKSLLSAVQMASKQMKGAFALGVVHLEHPEQLVAVRQGSPLVIGCGNSENFIASDPLALRTYAKTVRYLEEGDTAYLTSSICDIYNQNGEKVDRIAYELKDDSVVVSKGHYRHFMLKEIFEQPRVLLDTQMGRVINPSVLRASFGVELSQMLHQVENIHIIACGTSYHAGLIAKYWLEEKTNIAVSVEVASEYRYRHVVVKPNTLLMTISQSGETADTLAALRKGKTMGYLSTLAICNVASSTLVRESNNAFLTRAGIEIGVASTKAFTTQLLALLMLTAAFASDDEAVEICSELQKVSGYCESVLELDHQIQVYAQKLVQKNHTLFLGRGIYFPVALEAALKLKEISYIHAEAYPAGELKHGPLALVDHNMPVVVIAPRDDLIDKLQSNVQEVQARGGKVVLFADESWSADHAEGLDLIRVPSCSAMLAPIVYSLPMQLLAYYVAVAKGTDVDQPRNLAKSVTVE